jgi:hypothetical protein
MIVVNGKKRNQVFDSLGDRRGPIGVPDTPRSCFYRHLTDTKNILDEIGAERPADQ